jgi:hypothetical protein
MSALPAFWMVVFGGMLALMLPGIAAVFLYAAVQWHRNV